MIDSLGPVFGKFVNNFSWRRLAALAALLVIGGAVLLVAEAATGYFRLGRLTRSAALLKELAVISPQISKESDEVVVSAFKAIRNELADFTNHRLPPFDVPAWFTQAVASAVPWALLVLLIYFSGAESWRKAMLAVMVISIPFVLGGAFVPSSWPPGFRYLAYPFGSCVIAFVVMAFLGKRR